MGLNKKVIDTGRTFIAIENSNLDSLYKADIMFFQDPLSSEIYHLHKSGLKENQIIQKLGLNIKQIKNEVY